MINTMYDVIYLGRCQEINGLINDVNVLTSQGDTMKAEDYMDMDSARSKAIAQLAEICAAMGLNWTASDSQFTIDLPKYVAMKAAAQVEFIPPPTRRKTFDITTWGEPGPIEGLPDDLQLPDYGEILEEGQPPKGDPEAEA